MTCPRCPGRLFPESDRDLGVVRTCLACGYVAYAGPPAEYDEAEEVALRTSEATLRSFARRRGAKRRGQRR